MQSQTDTYSVACNEIAATLSKMDNLDLRSVKRVIKQVSAKYTLSSLPKNADILNHTQTSLYDEVRKLLMVRPTFLTVVVSLHAFASSRLEDLKPFNAS